MHMYMLVCTTIYIHTYMYAYNNKHMVFDLPHVIKILNFKNDS